MIENLREFTLSLENFQLFDKYLIGYGGTFDGYPLPIDEIKYWLFMSLLQNEFIERGINALLVYVIADKGVFHNFGKNISTLEWRRRRMSEIKQLNKFFGNIFDVILQSDVKISNKEIMDVKSILSNRVDLLEKTIPPSRITQERNIGYLYTIDELLTFIKLSHNLPLIKIGPPREIFYDNLLKILKNNFYYIHLKPNYPVNCSWSLFLYREDIRKYGVTPYKVGEKFYLDKRVLITDDKKTIELKLRSTRIPSGFPIDVLNSYIDLIKLFSIYTNKAYKVSKNDIQSLANALYQIKESIFGDLV